MLRRGGKQPAVMDAVCMGNETAYRWPAPVMGEFALTFFNTLRFYR